ncbi:MAG: hypothetical protein ACLTK7_06090 [Clostridium paraputrificum]
MVKKKKIKEERFILHENLVQVDLLEDYWKYQKKLRESYYYLKSIFIKLTNNGFAYLKEKDELEQLNKKERIDSLVIKAKKLMDEYEDYDKAFLTEEKECLNYMVENQENNVSELIAATLENDDFPDISDTMLLENTLLAINLKCSIDSVQIELLTLVTDETFKIIDNLISKSNRLKNHYMYYRNKQLCEYQLSHSADEDRINTYKIDISEGKYKKDCNLIYPIYYKKRDHSYNLNFERERYRNANDLLMTYLRMVNEDEENKKREKRDKLQYWFNIVIGIMTIVTTFTAIATIVIEILTYKYK